MKLFAFYQEKISFRSVVSQHVRPVYRAASYFLVFLAFIFFIWFQWNVGKENINFLTMSFFLYALISYILALLILRSQYRKILELDSERKVVINNSILGFDHILLRNLNIKLVSEYLKKHEKGLKYIDVVMNNYESKNEMSRKHQNYKTGFFAIVSLWPLKNFIDTGYKFVIDNYNLVLLCIVLVSFLFFLMGLSALIYSLRFSLLTLNRNYADRETLLSYLKDIQEDLIKD